MSGLRFQHESTAVEDSRLKINGFEKLTSTCSSSKANLTILSVKHDIKTFHYDSAYHST